MERMSRCIPRSWAEATAAVAAVVVVTGEEAAAAAAAGMEQVVTMGVGWVREAAVKVTEATVEAAAAAAAAAQRRTHMRRAPCRWRR